MIPKIITINKVEEIEAIVSDFATKSNIELSHRIIVLPEKDELMLEQIHLMQKDIRISFSKEVLVTLVGVDDSSSEVQNSLLKCLEEDSERIQFLLLVKNPNRLLPTIVSRCSIIIHKSSENINLETKETTNIFSFQNNTDVTKEEAVKRIDTYIEYSSLSHVKVLRHLLTIRKLLLDNNMNPLLALDNILIFLVKTSTMNTIHGKK